MRGLRSLGEALLKGYLRDIQAVFFTVLFPLMFLFLFAGIFGDEGDQSQIEMVAIGDVELLETMPEEARAGFEDTFDVTESDDLDEAITQVREGDTTLAVTQDSDQMVIYYSQAEQVRSAVARYTFDSFVQTANLLATDEPPTYTVRSERVEDESLDVIAFFTPGLLGWAIAMSATFGAAATLVGWRTTKLLRRLRLSPVSTRSIVTARIGVTMLIALVQTGIFLGLATLVFGLQLTGWWWMSIPLLLAGTLCFMAFGLFAGSVTKTVEGATNLANLFVLPMAFLSGSFFPLDEMPRWIDAVSRLLPLRYLNEGMLDVMVRGLGPAAIWQPFLVLLAFAAAMTLLASRFFRWEAD
jgi:ABC-2 type transport system permease protein